MEWIEPEQGCDSDAEDLDSLQWNAPIDRNEKTVREARPLRVERRGALQAIVWVAAALLLGSAGTVYAGISVDEAQTDEQLPVVITAGNDHAVKHWDTNGRLLGAIGTHGEAITALAYAQGELVSAEAGGKLKGVNLATGKTDFDVKAHTEGSIAVSLASDGSLLATGGADSVLRLWDGKSGHFLTDFPKAHGGAITAIQMTSDHAHLVSGSADRILRIWNITGDAKHPAIQYQANIVAHDDAVNAISLSPDDKLIASVSGDGLLKIWNLSGGALVQRVKLGSGGLTVAFSPDGRTIATGAADGKIRLWNPENGMPLPFIGSHDRGVTALAWAPDGKILVSGGEDKTLRFWNVTTGRQIVRITAHDGAVRAIVLP
jgi:WD40 repeat protein